MAGIKKTMRQAGRELNQELEELGEVESVDLRDDTIDDEGNRFNPGDQVNMPLESLIEDVEGFRATLQGDEGALLRPTQYPPVAQGPRSETQDMQVRNAAQAVATLKNPEARKQLDPAQVATLKNIQEAMRVLPVPDVTTWVDSRRVTVPGEVHSVPNQLPRKESLKLLAQLLGGECVGIEKRSADGTINRCPCPVHRVARCAQQWGFRDKPVLWLSQHLFTKLKERNIWDGIPSDFPYDAELDGKKDSVAPQAIATLFSYESTDQIMLLARLHRVSVLGILRLVVTRICDASDAAMKPNDYTEQYDV